MRALTYAHICTHNQINVKKKRKKTTAIVQASLQELHFVLRPTEGAPSGLRLKVTPKHCVERLS